MKHEFHCLIDLWDYATGTLTMKHHGYQDAAQPKGCGLLGHNGTKPLGIVTELHFVSRKGRQGCLRFSWMGRVPIGLWPIKSLPITTFVSKKSPKKSNRSFSLYVCVFALIIHHTS